MSEQAHIYAVLSQPDGDGVYLPGDTLPRFDITERRDHTFESFVNACLRAHHGVISQVRRGLTPVNGSRGYHMAVVRNTVIPENIIWTPGREAEERLRAANDEIMLHFVRNALESRRN